MHNDQLGIEEEKRFVKALRSKDEKAYAIFFDHYAAALNGIISRVVGDQKPREKILSELVHDIWADIDSYKEEDQRLFTWMVKKARLRANNAKVKYSIKSAQKTIVTYAHVFNIRVPQLDITERELKIFDLVYYKGLSTQKVAKSNDMKNAEVRLIIRKILKKAKNTFKVK